MLVGLAQADEVSKPVVYWTLLDQFDEAYTLNDRLKILLVARSMEGAKKLHGALEGKPEGYLESRDAVFVADVSRMPQVISTLFAVPAMRDYNYRVLLDRQPQVAPRYPGALDTVLWLEMEQGAVKSQREYSDAASLEAALEQFAE
jgi:hypothetical protein